MASAGARGDWALRASDRGAPCRGPGAGSAGSTLQEARRAVEEAGERARREAEEAAAAQALKEAKAREDEAAAQEAAARARAEVLEARERRLRQIEDLLQNANESLTAGNTKAGRGPAPRHRGAPVGGGRVAARIGEASAGARCAFE